jgi:hypothetical protein
MGMALSRAISGEERTELYVFTVVSTACSSGVGDGSVTKFPSRSITREPSVGIASFWCVDLLPDLVERCFFMSDCWRKLIWFSSDSVICGECPSEAKQWTAGGEEGDPGCVTSIRFTTETCGGKQISRTGPLLPPLGKRVKVTVQACLHGKSTRRNRPGGSGFAMCRFETTG